MTFQLGAVSLVVVLAGCAQLLGLHPLARDAQTDDATTDVASASDAAVDAAVFLPSCRAIQAAQTGIASGTYTIDPDGPGGASPVTVACDMMTDGGGWTLVGKVDGQYAMANAWLVSNVGSVASPTIDVGQYSCIDAVALAVNESFEVRLTSSDASNWVKWPLPADRDLATWWRHSITVNAVQLDTPTTVTVTTSGGTTKTCYQDRSGINPNPQHGGSYPYTSSNGAGNTSGNDQCMSVGTMLPGTTVDGFNQNGNGYDAPTSETDWPNAGIGGPVHVAVWLR